MLKVQLNSMSKEEARGVFWIVNDKLLAYPFYENATFGVAKSGVTYNHKALWKELGNANKVPYNYYPRGRVEFSNKGKPIIYANPNIDEYDIAEIKKEFGLRTEPTVRYDYSDHYKCHLDDGWKPDR